MNVSPYLSAPDSYRRALPEVVATIVNGCGPGGWKVDLVPDNLLGLDISEPCDIHNWRYEEGETEEDKRVGDLELRGNLIATINHEHDWDDMVLRPHRYLLAYEYYEAVHLFGDSAFWAGKKKAA